MNEFEDSMDRMISEMCQLRNHSGPEYDKWLKRYTQSVQGHCKGIAKQYKQKPWLSGMEAFLRNEQKRRKAVT